MYLKDEEGTLKSSDVTATFVNGRPRIVKGVHVMRGSVRPVALPRSRVHGITPFAHPTLPCALQPPHCD